MPKPKSFPNQIRLSPVLFNLVEAYRKKEEITLSQAIRELLYLGLDALNNESPSKQIETFTEPEDYLIGRDDAAKILNIHKRTLYQWRRTNKLKYGEHYVLVQNQILYHKEALETLAHSDNDTAIASKCGNKKK